MSNKEIYDQSFCTSFSLSNEGVDEALEYNSIPEWDSIGHMELMAALEEGFEITLEMDDIIDFSSYKKGIEILKKYEIEL
jgi:acyl carrier protein